MPEALTCMDMKETAEICCPLFHAERWDGKDEVWDAKRFIRAKMPVIFHIPIFPLIGKAITKLMKQGEDAKMMPSDKEEALVMFTDPSPFRSEILLSVSGDVPGADNVALSGRFLSKVYDGEYKDVPKFMKSMDAYLEGKGAKAKRYFVHYAYCPGCAKKYGNNSMILFAEV
jgi:hypothetical protein